MATLPTFSHTIDIFRQQLLLEHLPGFHQWGNIDCKYNLQSTLLKGMKCPSYKGLVHRCILGNSCSSLKLLINNRLYIFTIKRYLPRCIYKANFTNWDPKKFSVLCPDFQWRHRVITWNAWARHNLGHIYINIHAFTN